jgi:hypothetical protein
MSNAAGRLARISSFRIQREEIIALEALERTTEIHPKRNDFDQVQWTRTLARYLSHH